VRANFNRGVLVGEVVRTCALSNGEEFNLQIRRNQSSMVSIWGKLGSMVEYLETFPAVDPTECRVMDPAEIGHAAGSLPLAYCAADASKLFPHLCSTLPAIQLAALLATTRLVGMECPGLFPLYAGLDLSFSEHAIGKPQLNYRVPRAIRFGAMSLAVDGHWFQGESSAFLRPRPCGQAAASELAQLVAKDAFSDQRAIVISGSRGLGRLPQSC
jgi:hypothetical protein